MISFWAKFTNGKRPWAVRRQSGIAAVVNALAKAGIELGENGSIIPRPKGKPRLGWEDVPLLSFTVP